MSDFHELKLTEFAARAAHEAVRSWYFTSGDERLEPWNVAPEWQRDVARQAVNLLADDPHLTDEQIYDRVSHPPEPDTPAFSDLPIYRRVGMRLFRVCALVILADGDI